MANLKQIALRIFSETLAAIDIPGTMQRKIARSGSHIRLNGELFDLAPFERLYVVSVGKAAIPMARGLLQVLAPAYAVEGIVVAPAPSTALPQSLRLIVAGHPVPDGQSFVAGQAVLDLLATADDRTLIFFLLSGGGSALMEQPLNPGVTLPDMQRLNSALVNCGASIEEMNAVRKHLSAVKGGRLAAAAAGAMKITLGITDVPQGRESALASGPTLPDPTTVTDACDVVRRFQLLAKFPESIRSLFDCPENIPETPKAGQAAFSRAAFQLLLGRDDLFHPAHRAAEAQGFVTVCDNTTDDWPVAQAADFLLAQLADLKLANPTRPVAVIADGEVASRVTGNGIGGRNSAFVLNCVPKIAGHGIAVLSVGTDGIDGSSPAAGAMADGQSASRAQALRLDPEEYFARSDSYTFFKSLGDTIETGATGNNLRDLRILLAE